MQILLCQSLQDVPRAISSSLLFSTPHNSQEIAANGFRRMGLPGASRRLAEAMFEKFREGNSSETLN